MGEKQSPSQAFLLHCMVSGDQRNRRDVFLPSVSKVIDDCEKNGATIDQGVPVHARGIDWNGDWEEQEDPNGEKIGQSSQVDDDASPT